MKKQISLKEIVKSKRLKARSGGLDRDHVEGLAFAYEKGEEIEAPRVWVVKGLVGYFLTRGWHRIAALEKLGRSRVECEVKNGSFEEALLDAVQGDVANGLRRSNKDKKQCVDLLLKQFGEWSDRKIAEEAGVSHPFVSECRVVTVTTDAKKPLKKPSSPTHDGLVKLVKFAPTRSKADDWLSLVVKAATALVEEIKEA